MKVEKTSISRPVHMIPDMGDRERNAPLVNSLHIVIRDGLFKSGRSSWQWISQLIHGRPKSIDSTALPTFTKRCSSRTASMKAANASDNEHSGELVPSIDFGEPSVIQVPQAFWRDAVKQLHLSELHCWAHEIETPQELLWERIDFLVYRESPAAWEVLSYIVQSDDPLEFSRVYEAVKEDVLSLSSYLSTQGLPISFISKQLWRLWAFCIVSESSYIHGDCVFHQLNWLRGPKTKRAALGPWSRRCIDRYRIQTNDQSWMLKHTNGIFAQGMLYDGVLLKSTACDMETVWNSIVVPHGIVEAQGKDFQQNAEFCISYVSEKGVIHMLARPRGPRDILNLLKNRTTPLTMI